METGRSKRRYIRKEYEVKFELGGRILRTEPIKSPGEALDYIEMLRTAGLTLKEINETKYVEIRGTPSDTSHSQIDEKALRKEAGRGPNFNQGMLDSF